jgi:hypothetical protein
MMFVDESNEAYHSRKEMSASMLKKLDQSPRVFEAHYITGEAAKEPSAAMVFGTMVHAAILEPDEFASRYLVCPDECSDRRTKAYKEWAATLGDREPITATDANRIARCAAAVQCNTVASAILQAATIREKSFAYKDFLTGVDCRVRFDALAGDVVVDLKTVSDGSEEAFAKSIADFGYHLQAAHYLEGFKTLDPSRDWQFVFITVETQAPFRSRVFKLDADALMIAETRRTELLESYKIRMETGDWSEPGESEVTVLSLPKWYKTKALAV